MSKSAEDLFPNKNPCADVPDRGLAGYHLRPIPIRGVYGERSKIIEEMLECEEAHSQGCGIMLMLELSDLVGAIRGYLRAHACHLSDLVRYKGVYKEQWQWVVVLQAFEKFQKAETFLQDCNILDYILHTIEGFIRRWNLEMLDLTRMADATDRAFRAGHRRRKDGGETIIFPAA